MRALIFSSRRLSTTPNGYHTAKSVRRLPDVYVRLLKECTEPTLRQLNQLQCQIIATGLQSNLIAATKLTHRLSELGHLAQAESLVSAIPSPDLFLFNVLLRAYADHGCLSNSLGLYIRILQLYPHLVPDNFTFSFAVSCVASFGSSLPGRLLHAHAIIHGFGFDRFVASALTSFYVNFEDLGSARQLFDGVPHRDTVSWNTMIAGLVQNCCFEEALGLFLDMFSLGTSRLDAATLSVILPAAAELQKLELGRKMHCIAIKIGCELHVRVLTGLISLYGKCSEVESAEFLFLRAETRDSVSWNAMISGYSVNSMTEESVCLFREMIIAGIKVNSSTMVALIPVFSPYGHLKLSSSIHGYAVKSGVSGPVSVATALVTVFARCSDMVSARILFDEIPDKSLASWNAMISGYAQMGFTRESVELFHQMQSQDVEPNLVTLTSVLSACAHLGALALGRWIHDLILQKGYECNVYVSTALIDMYAKCGNINIAREVFDNLGDRNVVSWNAMIAGYGMHGHAMEALKLYSEMLSSCIKPTSVTFVGLIFACSHAGFVSRGWQLFKSMTHEYSIQPTIEHYSCMVDLLGRAGQLDDALEFVNTMPMKPTVGVWGALLGACMVHRDLRLANVAADRLFELEPDNVGYYVLLSNIYSTSGRWREAARIREILRSKKMVKTPGCTLIELDNKVHTFKSDDRAHPRSKSIYEMLEKLAGKLLEAGYEPITELALHDVEEEEKESMLNVHSEKLAIALGLISTEPGTPIRIIKNLRVCLDCHTATKFISKVTERLITVRDSNRFHHFSNGVCSCGDYW